MGGSEKAEIKVMFIRNSVTRHYYLGLRDLWFPILRIAQLQLATQTHFYEETTFKSHLTVTERKDINLGTKHQSPTQYACLETTYSQLCTLNLMSRLVTSEHHIHLRIDNVL